MGVDPRFLSTPVKRDIEEILDRWAINGLAVGVLLSPTYSGSEAQEKGWRTETLCFGKANGRGKSVTMCARVRVLGVLM